jgi:hypothetical protein
LTAVAEFRLATTVVEATTNGAVPVVSVEVIWPLALRVVKAPEEGVPPPIAPGEGSDDVEPPRDTEVPATVIAEFASPALVNVPVNPS